MTAARSARWAGRLVRAAAALIGLGVIAAAAVAVAVRLVPLPPGFFEAPSVSVNYRDGHPAHVFLSPDDKYRVAVRDLTAVDRDYLAALLAFEDRRFHAHGGVDLWAVARAALTNLAAGRVVSGASTLTMQLVRMREPRPRTLRSKAIEAFRALQLEVRMSKDEILESYLTHLPFGGNREGIEIATRAFFGHGPEHLSPHEIAVLLAVPQRPGPRSPSVAHADRLRRARDHVLDALDLAPGASNVPVPLHRFPIPRELPHLAERLRVEHPGRARIDTTLDRDAQRMAEGVLARARAQLATRGIYNGAALLIDHARGEVRAAVGNLAFDPSVPGSQIAAFDVPRSVGSTLKPIIYGLALEAGLILPSTLLADVPRIYPGYRPENYDGGFEGAVPARQALARSLNLPFVDLLAEIGVEAFIGRLVGLGADHLDDTPGHHGLSAAIGAVELTPLELGQLYTGIARSDGRVVTLRLLADAAPRAPMALFSPGAAFLVRDALDDRDRPDFPDRGRFRGVPAGVHWKTGTSFANRDAWAVGSDARHTGLIWLGNLDRTPSRHLVGASAAGPLLFDLLEGLPGPAPAPAPAGPKGRGPGLTEVEVCAVSGRPAAPACPHRRAAFALAHRVPIERCPVHVSRWIDPASGLELPPSCIAEGERREATFEVWPAEIVRYLGVSARRLPAPPALDPRCADPSPGPPPSITSPAETTRMLVPGLAASEQEVPLEATGRGGLRWFVDGRYVGGAEGGDRVWWTPRAGRHELLVMDRAGRKSRRWIEVIGPP